MNANSRDDPLPGVVLRGHDIDGLAGAVAERVGPVTGTAVVCARLTAPTPASAAVIHDVVDALADAGAEQIVVGAALRAHDRDRGHRSIPELARSAGLFGRTRRGRPYRVADLGEDLLPADAPAASVLHGQAISRYWAVADTRVVVGRAVTDLLQAFAGSLDALAGACPEIPGAELADIVSGLLQFRPPTLAVVDATVTSDGPDGARLVHAAPTDTVIVASDTLVADCALAILMGEDRSQSPLVERALADLGQPSGHLSGDLTPFSVITRPQVLARRSARRAARTLRAERVLTAAIGGPDIGAEAGDSVLSALRSIVTPAVAAAADPTGQAALVGLLTAAATAVEQYQAGVIGFAKDRLERRVVPLGFDPAGVPASAYDDLPGFFAPFDAIIDALPDGTQDTGSGSGPDVMRWTLVDGATVFEYSRDIAADFDDFVARVDVAEGISLMADYIGGRRVPVPGPVGRLRQVERNLYLPQPNYLAAWGGRPIDVCKIELVEKDHERHRLWWRTISSPNGSATYDDGTLTFARTAAGVRATVRGRQLFTLPPFWAAVDLSRLPELRDPLLQDAYRRFFTTTFDNLEACFEGREFRIGRPPADLGEPLATATVQLLLDVARDWIRTHVGGKDRPAPVGSPAGVLGGAAGAGSSDDAVDANGFRHVRGAR